MTGHAQSATRRAQSLAQSQSRFTSCSITSLLLLLLLLNVGQEGEPPLLGEDGQRVLHECRELDYMTHIVLRMFENTT